MTSKFTRIDITNCGQCRVTILIPRGIRKNYESFRYYDFITFIIDQYYEIQIMLCNVICFNLLEISIENQINTHHPTKNYMN